MEFIRLHLTHIFVAVFIVLFYGELSYKVKGNRVGIVYNVGDNITLNCYIPRYGTNNNIWYRNRASLADAYDIYTDDPRIGQEYKADHNSSNSRYTLLINDSNIADTGIYICYRNIRNVLHEVIYYNVAVIGCTCSIHPLDNERVTCDLENFRVESPVQIPILMNGNVNRIVDINQTTISFSISRHELYNSLHFEFRPYTNVISNIRCMLPAQFTSPYPSTRNPTTTLIPTTQNEQAEAPFTTSQKSISSAAISTGGHHTRQNKNSNQGKNLSNSDITMIIVISGSVIILILIGLIVVLRCKQAKNRRGNKDTGIASVDSKDTKEHPEACYESVDDASQRGLLKSTSNEKMKDKSENQPSADLHGGMVENILYDSSDKIAESSISRTEGPLDNALYAMPDKRKTLDRESKSGVIDESSAADILYGNSVIITQQGQKDNQGGDQYENVEMPGSGGGGDAEEIPLYEMPDKAPQRNTLKTTPKAGQTSTMSKDEMVDVNELYAEVDKTKKK